MTNKELETKLNELIARVEKLENKDSEKITLEEFFASDKNLAIHCDTEERANKLLCAFDRMGRTWDSDIIKYYVNENYFKKYTENTCYTSDGKFGSTGMCKNANYKIYEFEDIILPEEPKWQFTENEKKLLSLVDEKYRWIVRDSDNIINLYENKPVKADVYWFLNTYGAVKCISYESVFTDITFDCIKWTDTEPCEFRKYI